MEETTTQSYRLLSQQTMRVRWGDMDALGHVNNTLYFRYMEQVRIAWFEAIGVPMIDNGIGPVIVRADCNFIVPIVYPATVNVTNCVRHVGNSSFTLYHEIRDAADASLMYANGEAVMAWADHAAGRSVPLPGRIRALLGGSSD
ncbi:MAG TPA: thioesterase family protein [Burkholderiales bacterium]|nr:thioesterase family protein [Burkholderiales bacterium]